MEAGGSSLFVRAKTPMIDSSCKSGVTNSRGRLFRNASNHDHSTPQVPPPPTPYPSRRSPLNSVCELTDIPGNFSKLPNCRHTHPSRARVFVHKRACFLFFIYFFFFFFFKICASVCELTRLIQGAECIRRCAERIFANHICGSVSKYSRTEGETSNICHSGASKSPRARHVGCARALPKVHHVICSVRLSPSVSLTRMSSRLVSPPCKTSLLLALLFRRQKK